MNQIKRKVDLYPWLKRGGMIAIFAICFYFSCNLQMNEAPDEYMRYDLPLFLLKYGKLPLGDEPDLINPIWGFSYGYTPYLPSLISFVFMKISLLFTKDPEVLLIAARQVNTIAIALTWLVCCKIGELIFNRKTAILLFAVLVCYLPQFMFLSSYLNNDTVSVLASALIVYFWLRGDQDNWQTSTCIWFGFSLGILALTYYNAYAFILCSIFFYLWSAIRKKNGWKSVIGKGLLIFIAAFSIGGWFFIRNLIIRDGDLLAMKSMYASGEIHAMPGYALSERQTPKAVGMSILEMLETDTLFNDMTWWEATAKSAVAYFGYMMEPVDDWFYAAYTWLLSIGLGTGIAGWFWIYRKKEWKFNLLFNCLLCMLIPVGLSIYYSWATDYQPQGRYVISMIVPLMLITASGYDAISSIGYKKFRLWIINVGVAVFYLVMCYQICTEVLIPECFGHPLIPANSTRMDISELLE